MKLSILTPTIPGREEKVKALSEKIQSQIGDLPVEHLIFSDNRKRSIGGKRQALVNIARGQYIAFIDDDDDLTDDYVSEILRATESGADVITFKQSAFYNEQHSTVVFRLGQKDGTYTNNGITPRNAWHNCAWNREKVLGCAFMESNYGEDLAWCIQARKRVKTEHHIDKVLHIYQHDRHLTAAPESGSI